MHYSIDKFCFAAQFPQIMNEGDELSKKWASGVLYKKIPNMISVYEPVFTHRITEITISCGTSCE